MNDPNLSILLEVASKCGKVITEKVRKRFELMDEIISKCYDYLGSVSEQDESELKELLESSTEVAYVNPSDEDDEEDDY